MLSAVTKMVEPMIKKQRTIYLMLKKVPTSVTQQFSSTAEKHFKLE